MKTSLHNRLIKMEARSTPGRRVKDMTDAELEDDLLTGIAQMIQCNESFRRRLQEIIIAPCGGEKA
jgi:hypothetical protein